MTLTKQHSLQHSSWLEDLSRDGYAIISDVLSSSFIEETRDAMYRVQKAIISDIGSERLTRAGELGVLRLMMKYDKHFFNFLEIPELIEVVDNTIGDTSILHLQNGFILPSFVEEGTPEVFQNSFHRDFNRHLNGYLASVNILFAIDEFTAENGATFIVPRTHQMPYPPEKHYIQKRARPALCPAGAMVVFDSTLWHAAGKNTSGNDRLAINHQFTKSFFKQQIDYVRALGNDAISALPERSQQLLGYYTRVVTSLDEYYQPPENRLYRSGQG